MTNRQRGAAGWLLIMIVVVLFAAVFVTCDLVMDDESEERNDGNDLGAPAWIMDNEPCRGDNACQGRQKKGCAEASAPCSDDDKVTVIVCLEPDSCHFEGTPA